MPISKVKEKISVSNAAKEKLQTAPKELLRRGLLDGTQRLHGQLRDAAEGGQRQETELERAQDQARVATQRAVRQLGKQAPKKRSRDDGQQEVNPGVAADSSDVPVSEVRGATDIQPRLKEPVRIKTRESTHDSLPNREPVHTVRSDAPKIKTRESAHSSMPENRSHADTSKPSTPNIRTKEAASGLLKVDRASVDLPKVNKPEIKTKDAYIHHQTAKTVQRKPDFMVQNTVDAVLPDSQLSQPVEQGRQKFALKRQKQITAQRAAGKKADLQHGPEGAAPARPRNTEAVRHSGTSTLSARGDGSSPENIVRGATSGKQHKIKNARAEAKAVGQTSHQAIKTVGKPKQAVTTGTHSAQVIQQRMRSAIQAQQRAVRAAGAARRVAAGMDKPLMKAAVSALRGAASALRSLAAPLAAGGGAVIAIVLVLCLVGALLMSPLGVFFSGEDSGSGVAMPNAVQEINQEYDAAIEALKAEATYDELSMSGSRAPWQEVLAVYAVKATTGPDNGQDVISIDDAKKELLRQVFWDMNELSGFTSTVSGGEGEEDVTTLYITVTPRTTDEMADLYGFSESQRQQLAELLSDDYRDLWSKALYGIGSGDGEIVAVALSQVGNIGGQPYWSWYGFSYRVDWCAIFVSWCANECGYIDAGVVPKFAGCVQGVQWFKERGRWQDRSNTPNPGDLIFFDWDDPGGFSGPQDNVPDHVGIVEKVENGRVYTVEGNSGDKCVQRSYPVGYYEIYGYGTPGL